MTFCGCINPSEMMTLRLQILKFSLLTQRPPPSATHSPPPPPGLSPAAVLLYRANMLYESCQNKGKPDDISRENF